MLTGTQPLRLLPESVLSSPEIPSEIPSGSDGHTGMALFIQLSAIVTASFHCLRGSGGSKWGGNQPGRDKAALVLQSLPMESLPKHAGHDRGSQASG